MATPMKTWIKQAKKEAPVDDLRKMSTEYFFRDPIRTELANRDFFFTPADGFITLQGRFDPESDLVDVKGANITLNSLLGPSAIDTPALAIGIFMSFLDVHMNRSPTECILTRNNLPPLRTQNQPMLWAEHDILEDLHLNKQHFGFMADNERVVNTCFVPHLRYTYYVVQIADSDVNYIVHLKSNPVAWFNQNERFGQIRWGSMCVLIMPLDERYKFKPLCKISDHVECSIDPLVKISY